MNNVYICEAQRDMEWAQTIWRDSKRNRAQLKRMSELLAMPIELCEELFKLKSESQKKETKKRELVVLTDRIREACEERRKAKGKSVRWIRLHVDEGYFYVAKGEGRIGKARLQKITDYLGVELDEIM